MVDGVARPPSRSPVVDLAGERIRRNREEIIVEIGIGLPTTIPDTEGSTLLEWARRADKAGFSTLSTIGRLVYPN